MKKDYGKFLKDHGETDWWQLQFATNTWSSLAPSADDLTSLQSHAAD
jgi:hypothetical protein